MTGGYLIGFVVAAAIVGRLAELGWDRRLPGSLVAMAIGTAVIYAIGVPWLKVTTGMPWSDAVAGGHDPVPGLGPGQGRHRRGRCSRSAWWLVGRRPEDR